MSEVSKTEILQAFVEQLGKVPAILLSTPAGVGLVSILTGTALKAMGAGNKLQLKAEYAGSQNWLDTVYYPTLKADGISTVEEFCTRHPTSTSGAPFCETVNTLTVDLFPFDLSFSVAGLKLTLIPKEFGDMNVPDMLIVGGFMGLTATFWDGVVKGLGEIVPG